MSSTYTKTADDEEPIVTCSQLLEQIKDEEEELDRERALYGNCDVDSCTYAKGYVKRQALFTCTTCTRNDQQAGICTACAYHCHANHEVNELYTKRLFRCDCGNSKLSHQPCKLYPNKDPENTLNKYNDNFRGIYCICKRAFDKENQMDDDEMRQCIVCEDWFHSQHLGVPLPIEENESNQMDVICQACVTQFPFLVAYDESGTNTDEQSTIENNTTAIENSSTCVRRISENKNEIHTIFLREGWRKRLCRCMDCSKLYDELKLTSIFDEDDAIQEYEKQALAKSENLDGDKILTESLENLGYVRKIEVLKGINDFKVSLGNFLREKAREDGVLTAEDVAKFFAGLKEKREEQKRTMFIPPDTCKY